MAGRMISRLFTVGGVLMWLAIAGCVSQEEITRQFQANRRAGYESLLRDSTAEGTARADFITGSLDIAEAVELALTHNKEVQAAKLKLLEARGRMTEAISTALPTVGFSGSALANDNSGLLRQKETYELGLLARQPLYLGGLAGAALDAAVVFKYMSRQELRLAIQAVRLKVESRYLGAVLAAELEEVARQGRRDAEEHLKDVQKKLKFGAGTRFEVLRAQVRLNGMEAELIRRHNQARLAVAALLNELGVSQLSRVELSEQLEYEPMAVATEQCLEQAMGQRAELLIGESQVQLARDNVISQKAINRPKVFLQGLYQRNYPGFSANFSDFSSDSDGDGGSSESPGKEWERTMSGGIVVEWPFFDGFETAGKVTQAKSLLRRQQVELKKGEQLVQLQVTAALLNLESSKEFVESQEGNVANAEEALRLAQVSFREGAAASLDVISAEVALSAARSDYIKAVHDHELAKLNLNGAIGTLGEAGLPRQLEQQDVAEAEEPADDTAKREPTIE